MLLFNVRHTDKKHQGLNKAEGISCQENKLDHPTVWSKTPRDIPVISWVALWRVQP